MNQTFVPVSVVLAAGNFAAQKHCGQFRKGAEHAPYINHPVAVAHLLANEAGIVDPITLAAALLHDTIEDTETSAAEISTEFGPTIAAVVVEVTDDKSLPKAERKRLQIEHASTISRHAKLVKIADKICNLRDINRSPPVDWTLDRRREYFAWAQKVGVGLSGESPALDRLLETELARAP